MLVRRRLPVRETVPSPCFTAVLDAEWAARARRNRDLDLERGRSIAEGGAR